MIEPPVHDQGLPVATATDRQLIEWRHELEVILRNSPLAFGHTDELAAVEAAILEARDAMQWLGNTGTRAQLSDLEARRDELAKHALTREAWLEDNAGLFHRYSAVVEELQHRLNARIVRYELDPPADLLLALGVRPTQLERLQQWTRAVSAYTEARLGVGPQVDLNDPAVLGAAALRDALAVYDGFSRVLDQPAPSLRLASG